MALCWQELDSAQDAQCSRVGRFGEDPTATYLPDSSPSSEALPIPLS